MLTATSMFICRTAARPARPPAPGRLVREARVIRRTDDPAIRPYEAEELCGEVYESRRAAIAVATRLRAAGWVVVEHRHHSPRRPDSVEMVASVYHPVSYESPGDLLAARPPDR